MGRPDPVVALGTVLGIWAHPQDETLVSAGVMLCARRAGNRVVVATATRGERGGREPARWPPERVARLRSDELAAALAVVGVVEHRFLDHPDGRCADVPLDTAAAQVARLIAEVRPDTILTFGPDGMYGDPDHGAVYTWVTSAARDGAARLLYAACPAVEHPTLALDLDLTPELRAGKAAALRAYSSQLSGLHRDEPCERLIREDPSREGFVAAG